MSSCITFGLNKSSYRNCGEGLREPDLDIVCLSEVSKNSLQQYGRLGYSYQDLMPHNSDNGVAILYKTNKFKEVKVIRQGGLFVDLECNESRKIVRVAASCLNEYQGSSPKDQVKAVSQQIETAGNVHLFVAGGIFIGNERFLAPTQPSSQIKIKVDQSENSRYDQFLYRNDANSISWMLYKVVHDAKVTSTLMDPDDANSALIAMKFEIENAPLSPASSHTSSIDDLLALTHVCNLDDDE